MGRGIGRNGCKKEKVDKLRAQNGKEKKNRKRKMEVEKRQVKIKWKEEQIFGRSEEE